MKRQLFAAASLLLMINATAQAPWVLPGNAGTDPADDFVGTTDNRELVFRTDDLFRFRLNKTETYGTLGGFTNVPANGFALISPKSNFINNAPGPFSLLHLAAENDNAQQGSYRDWMNIGLTLTGNADHSYIGLKAAALDNTDVVFHWSDNPSKFLKDRVRFIFTSGYDPTDDTGARSLEGLEALRLFPVDNDNVNVGVGDWFAANFNEPSITEPTERLDIVDGRVRIRQLPTDDEEPTEDKVMVVDDDGVVKWRSATGIVAAGDCKWTISGGTNNNNVWTAVGSSSACPNSGNRVGIGTNAPAHKLHVHVAGTSGAKTAIFGNAQGGGGPNIGVHGIGSGSGTINYGGFAETLGGGSLSYGTWSEARYGTTATYGLYAVANHGPSSSYTPYTYGVYGRAFASATLGSYAIYGDNPAGDATNNKWAGYFNGKVYSPYGQWVPSDAGLKLGAETVSTEDAISDVVMALQVKRYTYDQAAHPSMTLPEGERVGLIAQDVEEVLPMLVTEALHPAEFDPDGAEVHPAIAFKAVNYTGLIPYLVLSLQRQHERLAQLEQALQACCTAGSDYDQRNGVFDEELSDPASRRLLTIAPNPFTEQTTVSYTLERGGRAMLLMNGSDGKHLQVLEEGARSAGQYQYVWHTAHLASGVYYVTLLLDGEPLVKRAVKVR